MATSLSISVQVGWGGGGGGGGGDWGASRFRDLDRILVLPKDYITARSPRRWVSKTYKYQNVRKGISYMHL